MLAGLTSPVTVDWWAVVLDGVIGAVVGGAFTSTVAFVLARRSKEDQREVAREQAALAAAESVSQALMEASNVFADVMGHYDEAARGKRIVAVQRFDREVEAKLPALVKEAANFRGVLNTARDVLEGYLEQVEALVAANSTGDPFAADSKSSAKALWEHEFKLRQEMQPWHRYALDYLGSFRSGLKPPVPVEPPKWRMDQDEVKRRLKTGVLET